MDKLRRSLRTGYGQSRAMSVTSTSSTVVQFRTSACNVEGYTLPLVDRYVKNKWSISTGADINNLQCTFFHSFYGYYTHFFSISLLLKELLSLNFSLIYVNSVFRFCFIGIMLSSVSNNLLLLICLVFLFLSLFRN